MHPHGVLLQKLYTCLDRNDHIGMAECYHPDAEFQDIAFSLRGKKQIHAMWHMISKADLRATFTIQRADDHSGVVDLVDDYKFKDPQGPGKRVINVIRPEFQFRDGLISRHQDTCNALKWGTQALGPVKGVISWLIPSTCRKTAQAKLDAFIREHPEYQ